MRKISIDGARFGPRGPEEPSYLVLSGSYEDLDDPKGYDDTVEISIPISLLERVVRAGRE